MAITRQTVSVGDLDVINLYKELMQASTGEDSAYLRAKETLKDLFDTPEVTDPDGITGIGNKLSDREKSEVLAKVITDISVNITNTAMQTAVAVAIENRDAPYKLAKMSADAALTDQQRLKMLADTSLSNKQTEQITANIDYQTIQGWSIQANMYRDTGYNSPASVATKVLPVLSRTETGVKYQEARVGEGKVYETWSSAIKANGYVGYSVTDGVLAANYTTDTTGLVHEQTRVAARNVLAFDDNMRQHAVNSSASMLGTMIGSESFASPTDYTPYLDKWFNSMDYLEQTKNTAAGTMSVAFPTALTKGSEHTVTGEVTGIAMGTSVRLRYSDVNKTVLGGVSIVLPNGTFSITTAAGTTSTISNGNVTCECLIIDAMGTTVTRSQAYTVA